MFDSWTKEQLIIEVKRLRSEVYRLTLLNNINSPSLAQEPDGYAGPATKPISEYLIRPDLPSDRSGQIPSSQDIVEALKDPDYAEPILTPAIQRLQASAEKIAASKKEAEEYDKKEYSGWCLRITDFESLKFLYLKSPDDRSLSIQVDYSQEVNGIQNRPQILFQFASAVGVRDIPGVWPRWWKLTRGKKRFIISCGRLYYTITATSDDQDKLLVDFFNHLQTIRVRSINAVDGV